LAAHAIARAVENIELDSVDLLIVQNVGNIVCLAEFDIGENNRVVMLSVTEGKDKPVKYPLMVRVCEAAILNKIDPLPYLDYNRKEVLNNIKQVHPEMPVFEL